MRSKRSGLTVWEIVLFTVFLAVAGGASVFFFFLNSEDVQYAQRKYEWAQQINRVLDAICLEISNSAQFEHPFNGSSRECFIRAAVDSGTLLPDESREGFAFSDSNLVYVSRTGDSTSNLRRLGSFENPLVRNCREGRFTRISSDLLEIRFIAQAPGAFGDSREFLRRINLRNR
jgi:hypothetical protein